MVHPGYWAARHSSKLDDVNRIFNRAEVLVARLPPPWRRSRRGRPPKFPPRRHAAVCVTMQHSNLTYREVEGHARSFMGESIDHSTVGWALKRLPENYLRALILFLYRDISGLAPPELYIVDSTGVSTPCLRRRRRAFETIWEHEHVKLHAIVGHSRRAGALVAVGATVTQDTVADVTQLGPLLEEFRADGEPLLGDKSYDSMGAREIARVHGLTPVFKPRKIEPKGIARKQAVREFERHRELYRQRGVGETLFGGIENRYGSKTRCKLTHTKVASTLLMVVAHNLRTFARVRAMKEHEILLVIWIYSTNSPQTKYFLNMGRIGGASR